MMERQQSLNDGERSESEKEEGKLRSKNGKDEAGVEKLRYHSERGIAMQDVNSRV